MNWKAQLNYTHTNAVVASPHSAETLTPAMLREAGERFARRTDNFAVGKAATCADMADKLNRFGSFASDKQRGYAEKLILWSQPRPSSASATPAPDASAQMTVPKLFTVMQKHSKFYAGALKITRRNQDTLCWLIWNNLCVGKIDDGVVSIYGRRIGADKDALVAMLVEFEMNPLAAAMKYGKLSGRCCSCNRDLTNDGSIEAGIGPICAGRFS